MKVSVVRVKRKRGSEPSAEVLFLEQKGRRRREEEEEQRDDDDDDGNNRDDDVCGIRERTVIGGGARGSDEEMFEERRERERGGASETDRKGFGVHSNGFEEFEAVETEPVGVSVERADDVFEVLA